MGAIQNKRYGSYIVTWRDICKHTYISPQHQVIVKNFLSKIRHAGIVGDTDPSDIKCITLTNTIAFLLMLLSSGFIPLFLFYLPATEFITYVFIICAGFNFGVVILNYYKKYTLSVIFFASFSLIFLIISSIILGRESNLHYFIICSLYLIFFVFPRHKKHIMYLFIALFILSFVGLEIWFLNFDRLMNAEPLFFDIVRYSLFIGIIFFVFVISYHAYNVVNISEHALKEAQGKVEKSYSLISKYVAPQLADTIADGQIDLIWKHYRKKWVFRRICNCCKIFYIRKTQGQFFSIMFPNQINLAISYGIC